MNELTKFLVDNILKEEEDTLGTVALFGGGFKPPTKGHLEVVLQGLKEHPEVKQIHILVGSGERNGVTQEEAIKIWEMYQKFIPVSSQIIPVQSPFSYIKTYLQDHPDEKVYQFIGARPDNPEDEADVAQRTAYAKKYSKNAMPVKVQTKGGVSGTMARKAALSGNNDEFITYFPSDLTDAEKQEIINMISSVIKEQLNENASYSSDIDYKSLIKELTKYMIKDGWNIQPLPKVVFKHGDTENARDFFGKTAYYDPNTKTIVLYTEGRHPKDIVRSFSHEMVHHEQNLDGRLGDIYTTNTQEDDRLNDIEKEANLNGTMTFRNWTDSLNENLSKEEAWKKFKKDKYVTDKTVIQARKDFEKIWNDSLQEKKVKDPFGLNAYARELAKGLEEALTIGDKEVERIDKPTNNPEDAIVIYKDGTTEPYLDTLNEGRYDSISRQLASIALNVWKSDFKDGASYGYFTGEITPEEYPTDLTFTFKALGRFVDGNYTHNGYSKSDGEVGVKYEIPKDAIPQIWEEVYMDLISTIRHEIEHQTQGGKNVKQGKGMASDQKLRQLIKKGGSDIVRYVTLPKEIESNVQGLYLKAKKWRRPYDEIVDEYIKDFLKITNPSDVNYVKSKWQEVAKKRSLPNLLNEGRYDTFVNKLSRIVFEMFKDIHDRGDKEGEFEFRVDHPDDEHDIPSEDFYFDLVGTVKITDDEYEVDGGANAGFDKEGEEITPMLAVKFKIPKNPDWQKVSFDIKDVIRHELEHLTQDGENVKGGTDSDDPKLVRPSKQMDDDQTIRDLIDLDLLPKADYFRLPKEIDAMLQGLYFKAKKSRTPFKDVINTYLDTQPINAEERKNILKIWRNRAKALSLPVFETETGEMPTETSKLFKIFLDMDGVIVDFDKRFEEQFGMPPREFEDNFGSDKFWEKIDSKGVGFWRGMDWMPGGQQLYNRVAKHDHALLSSPSRSDLSKIGKRMWRKDNTPNTKLILARSYNKKNYADKSNILIDDRADNIQQWKDAGGIGILYQSADQVMKELDKLGL
jgi:hypothetical protein